METAEAQREQIAQLTDALEPSESQREEIQRRKQTLEEDMQASIQALEKDMELQTLRAVDKERKRWEDREE